MLQRSFSLLMSRTNLDFQAQQDMALAAAMKSDAAARLLRGFPPQGIERNGKLAYAATAGVGAVYRLR